jgi:hypothetical protein
MDLNFGLITVEKDRAIVEIKDDKGNVAKHYSYDYSELAFDDELLRFSTFCEAKSSKHQLLTMIAHMLKEVLILDTFAVMILVVAPASIVLGLLAALMALFKSVFSKVF